MVHRVREMLAHRGPDGEGSRVGRQDRPSRLWSSVAFEEWAGLGLIAVARRPDDVLTDRNGPPQIHAERFPECLEGPPQ